MGVHCGSLGVGGQGHWWQRPQEILYLCVLSQRLLFWHQDLTLPKCLHVPVLECLESNKNRMGTHPNHHDRLSKLVLRSQPPLNTPLDMALPTRGTRSSSTTSGQAPVSPTEVCTSPFTNFTYQGQTSEARGSTILKKRDHKHRKLIWHRNMLQMKDKHKNLQ